MLLNPSKLEHFIWVYTCGTEQRLFNSKIFWERTSIVIFPLPKKNAQLYDRPFLLGEGGLGKKLHFWKGSHICIFPSCAEVSHVLGFVELHKMAARELTFL